MFWNQTKSLGVLEIILEFQDLAQYISSIILTNVAVTIMWYEHFLMILECLKQELKYGVIILM